MKNLKKMLTCLLALVMVLACVPAAFAAEVNNSTIDENVPCSLTIWKFDWTNALKDGVWTEDSFVSTGWRESYVEEVLGEAVRKGDDNDAPDNTLGNGQNANGYAIKGVKFSYLKVADAHVYSFGINLTKVFSDKDSETAEEADATVFYPVTSGDSLGKIIVKGLEDDEYVLTEIETANGYVLLQDQIHVLITASDDAARPCTAYTKDVLGVLQNDPHYAFDGGFDLHLAGIPQIPLTYNYLTASATVDGNAVEMRSDNGSANAAAQLKVVNNPGFDLPDTGDNGTMIFSVVGVLLMACSAAVIIIAASRRKKTAQQ